ncbi:TetR family transcriptional regulator [Acinetobacter sp. LoGeW2-3]|uniref:TetR/AcrR family transcriptional regulator n=1 Tax=Acinetobacter sp. LoGeW2-3 TaxID=1808001 RepID=UPI000C0590AE|nr:TetR/AcrR family transcriptional regulator [Acinetobacter sp. LoGeW2-3]ATO20313.1 TetR family transcriptional regulator [Acinetobacter sp. LoGeW2-3]
MSKLGRPVVMTAEERRTEILNVAEQLFGEKGFESVTMSEIAEAAGMSKKTLYVHFTDKQELFKSLVTCSYIWSEDAFQDVSEDPVDQLKESLYMIAKHVLSERHIKLCRLTIVGQLGMEGLADTFYEMGISTSRNHLISCVERIPEQQKTLKLSSEILVDMLFGAGIAKAFIDSLFKKQHIDLQEIYRLIDSSVNALFRA